MRHTIRTIVHAGAWIISSVMAVGLALGGTSADSVVAVSTSPDTFVRGDQTDAGFGTDVATAGDVNGDGYSDMVVAAPDFDGVVGDDAGRVFVYEGGRDGVGAVPAWRAEGGVGDERLGVSVAPAGDVNGDGFGDLIIGSLTRALVFHGSATGLGLNGTRSVGTADNADWVAIHPALGVASAGDVNGDGFDDVIVLADGMALVYHGSASGLAGTAAWTAMDADEAGTSFDNPQAPAVSGAGDVNGDGFDDVFILHELSDSSTEGYLYFSSSSGLDLGGTRPIGTAANADWTTLARPYVTGVPLGDVNGDGYADLLIGEFISTPVFTQTEFTVFLGSAGLPVEADRCGDNVIANRRRFSATAGDVNGDGFADIVVSGTGPQTINEPELATICLGGPTGLRNTSWEVDGGTAGGTAGDVNGDGFSDLFVGIPEADNLRPRSGRVRIYLGRGSSLAADPVAEAAGNNAGLFSAGDVNGDGFSDVVIERNSVSLGSPAGLRAGVPLPVNAERGEPLGDVNGDGYDDVITSRNTPPRILLGSPTGTMIDSGIGPLTAAFAAGDVNGDGLQDAVLDGQLYLGSTGATLEAAGWSTTGRGSPAGDANGDGFADLIVFDTDGSDRARLFAGSASGLTAVPVWRSELAADFAVPAGDVNGDGFADVAVLERCSGDGARIYLGSASGLGARAATILVDEGTFFCTSVLAVGDLDGDGYGDLVASQTGRVQDIQAYEVHVAIYFGSADGLQAAAGAARESDTGFEFFGDESPVAAGDVNGDGFGDLVMHGQNGQTVVFYGNEIRGLDHAPVQLLSGGLPLARGGVSDRTDAVRIAAVGRTPAGRDGVRLEWEMKPLGVPFDGCGLERSADSVDTGPVGVAGSTTSVEAIVMQHGGEVSCDDAESGGPGSLLPLDPGTPYHWRARILGDSPYFPRSPWLSLPLVGSNEVHVLTAGTREPAEFSPIGPGSGEVVFPDDVPVIHTWNRGPSLDSFSIQWSSSLAFQPLVSSGGGLTAAVEVGVFEPDAQLWSRILRLGRSPDFRDTPIFWRILGGTGGVTQQVGEIQVMRLAAAQRPVVLEPADGEEVLADEPRQLAWDTGHAEAFLIRFAANPALSRPRIDVGHDFTLTGTTFTATSEVWAQITDLGRLNADDVVYFTVFGRDSVGRTTWGPVQRMTIVRPEATGVAPTERRGFAAADETERSRRRVEPSRRGERDRSTRPR